METLKLCSVKRSVNCHASEQNIIC